MQRRERLTKDEAKDQIQQTPGIKALVEGASFVAVRGDGLGAREDHPHSEDSNTRGRESDHGQSHSKVSKRCCVSCAATHPLHYAASQTPSETDGMLGRESR